MSWFESQITTWYLEGLNSLVQAAKARGRGCRTSRNLITMVHLVDGKLRFDLST
mgnify:CR=1 FL=1